MKGSGGGYGFDEVTVIGQSLELAATEQDADTIRQMVSGLVSYLERVEVVFE